MSESLDQITPENLESVCAAVVAENAKLTTEQRLAALERAMFIANLGLVRVTKLVERLVAWSEKK